MWPAGVGERDVFLVGIADVFYLWAEGDTGLDHQEGEHGASR